MMRGSLTILYLLAGGCTQSVIQPTPEVTAPATRTVPPPSTVARCPAERFTTVGPIPADAKAAALLDLSSSQLPLALERLRETPSETTPALPINLAFSLSQWSWQVPLLRSTLARAGFHPTTLLYLALRDGSSVWAWPQGCDLDTVRDNLMTAWDMTLRTTAYGAKSAAPLGAEGTPSVAYDFVAWGSTAYLVVPAGRANAAAQQLGVSPGPSTMTLGPALHRLPGGPVRLAIRTEALVQTGATTSHEQSVTSHRVDAQGWFSTPPER